MVDTAPRQAFATHWSRLAPTDIQRARGSLVALAELISVHYDMSKSEALRQLQDSLAGRTDPALAPEDESRLEGEDAGRGDPRQVEPSVG